MWKRAMVASALLAATGLAGGCANDGGVLGDSLTTSSVSTAEKAPKVDPQCVALMSKIDALRKEGTPERIEKVSTGKGRTVSVKRESLQRITELDKTNAEFQSRCSTLTSGQRAAAATSPAPAPAAKDSAAQAATETAKKPVVATVSKSSAKTVTAAASTTPPSTAASATQATASSQ